MNRTAKMLLTGATAAVAGVAAATAATYASTEYMIRVALDRKQPRLAHLEAAKTMLRGYGEEGNFFQMLRMAGETLRDSPHARIWLRSYDGQLLCGHWFPVANPKRVIVAMHGWRSRWYQDFGTLAEFWRSHGCSVLYAEQRGQGSSGGQYMGFGMTERYDCRQWVQWVSEQCPHVGIYLAGVSMGATTVLLASELDLPQNVCGIMADCGFTTAEEIWKHVAQNNLHMIYRLHSLAAEQLCRARLHMGPRDCSTVEAMKHCCVPVLFAHGTDDHFVPVEMTYANYSACTAPKSLLIVPGADHGMSHHVEAQRYEQAMVDFWQKHDSTV